MEYFCNHKTLVNLVKDMETKKFSFNSPLQRQEDQWSRIQKSELIDSILRSYPLDPIRAIKLENGILDVIDGKQRATTIRSYLNDEFPLSKKLENVIIEGNEYIIGGKKFSKLDEAVQDKIKGYEIQVYIFMDCTDKDVREMFRRQNNGTPLKNSQKLTVYQSEKLNNVIFELASHELFAKLLSHTQITKDVNKDIIREVLMLSEASKDNPITSFRAKDMANFVSNYEVDDVKLEFIKQALDKLNEAIEESTKITKVSISFIIYGMYRTIKDKKGTEKYCDWLINTFIADYDSNEEYKQFTQNGTSNNENVTGRLNYFRSVIRGMQK